MNRSQQNRALKTVDELSRMFAELEPVARALILRNRFSSGQRKHFQNEFAEMQGEPGPHYSDTTGDDAVWDELRDTTGEAIERIADSMNQILASGTWLIKLANKSDVVARAELSIPDCLACGDPCPGKIVSGFDEKCYKRWLRAGRPDRGRFVATVRSEQKPEPADG